MRKLDLSVRILILKCISSWILLQVGRETKTKEFYPYLIWNKDTIQNMVKRV